MNKYGLIELSFKGYSDKNPFVDYTITALFKNKNEEKTIQGFYDGDGIYKVRFMPSFSGRYTYKVKGSFNENVFTGYFEVSENIQHHGPVQVTNQTHFKYADNTPYYSIGTTSYVWWLNDLWEDTLSSIKEAGFNKLRFCVFPKHYDYNFKDPACFPYVGTPMDSSVLTKENFFEYTGKKDGNHFDYYQLNPDYFKRLDKAIEALEVLNIEADLILMHPYDRWGFSDMPLDADKLYWQYMINRYGAYHHVWWSLANEYDVIKTKDNVYWKMFGEYLQANDPYNHLRSIHNCLKLYNHHESWITHCSIQRVDIYRTTEDVTQFKKEYNKPIVMDEIAYEGNLPYGWGNITGQEMVRRMYECALRGGYPGHSETYYDENIIFWSHGGKFKGESYKRVQFLLDLLKETPGPGLKNIDKDKDGILFEYWDCICAVVDGQDDTNYRMYYFSFMQPSFRDFYFEDKMHVEVIDTWNMIKEDKGVFSGRFRIELPQKQYMLIRMWKEKEL